jgi:hypothetical protein
VPEPAKRIPMGCSIVYNLKNRDMKKEESVMIAGICMIGIVLMIILAAIIL